MTVVKTSERWIVLRCVNPYCHNEGGRWVRKTTESEDEERCPECQHKGQRLEAIPARV